VSRVKIVDLAITVDEAEARWAEFERSRAEVAGTAEVSFEPLGDKRTRVTVTGESASVEGTADEFRKFVETAKPAPPSGAARGSPA
jgi:hypothetical protein